MKKVLTLIVLFFLSAPNANSQICNGDFDCDNDVDGTDAIKFMLDFYRSDCPDCVPVPVPKTGQSTSSATSDDGDLEMGVEWPNPRFTIIYCDTNGSCPNQGSDCDADTDTDVVTDNLTGLMWTRDANMFFVEKTWQQALSACNTLDFAGYDDWRLPNRFELESLLHLEYYDPALPNTAGTGQWSEGDPFTNQVPSYYWSSTTLASNTGYAWIVSFYGGAVYSNYVSNSTFARAVRKGQ